MNELIMRLTAVFRERDRRRSERPRGENKFTRSCHSLSTLSRDSNLHLNFSQTQSVSFDARDAQTHRSHFRLIHCAGQILASSWSTPETDRNVSLVSYKAEESWERQCFLRDIKWSHSLMTDRKNLSQALCGIIQRLKHIYTVSHSGDL